MNFVTRYPGIQNDYDLIFADTEFSRLPFPAEAMSDWATKVELLSIGLAGLDTQPAYEEFYGHRSLNKKIVKACDAFVLSDVIPQLGIVESGKLFSSHLQLKRMLIEFISGRRRLTGKTPLICVDWPGDALLLSPLLGLCGCLFLDGIPEIQEAMSSFFVGSYRRHNALHDALAIRHGFINSLPKS